MKTKSVFGYVTHTLSPLKNELKSFTLDGDDMIIRRVRMKDQNLEFNHSGNKIHIELPNTIGWNDTVDVRIDYSAYPRKGTYFFGPDETYPDQPWQAWTQGETEDNHHWVPLYDYPNERATLKRSLQ